MLLGVILLLLGTILGSVLLWQLTLRVPGFAAKLGLLGSDSSSAFVSHAIADIGAVDSELVQQLAEPPAVDPSRIPYMIDEKRSPETMRFLDHLPDETLTRTLRALWTWIPRSRTKDEKGYVNGMLAHLTNNGLQQFTRDQRIHWRPGSKSYAQPDVIVANRVLVEVKADLGTTSASDRSLGQMLRYLLAWKSKGPAILIICGKCEPLMRFIIQTYVHSWRTALRLPVTVWFAAEDRASAVEDRVHSPEIPWT